MPKAHEENGFIFRFYSDDHLPMHIHAQKAGEECVFLLGRIVEISNEAGETVQIVMEAPSIRENKGMNRADVRRALAIVEAQQAKLITRWQQHLG
ncbi:MAG TPA: DUF4160 domain-containing protein [Abditibacterium sp.]|jgi:hypothetical protein